MVFWGAGKAIESLWSFLGPKAKEDAQPCFEYDGKSDGWLPVYLDGVQVMFRDYDKSTPDTSVESRQSRTREDWIRYR